VILIGAGGHSKMVFDIVQSIGSRIDGYVDDADPPFAWRKITESEMEATDSPELAIAFVGLTCAALERRFNLMEKYRDKFKLRQIHNVFPQLVHPKALVSKGAFVGYGTQVMAGAAANYGAHIGFGCVINTGAIIEHDARIGDGCHIAPRATVLGGAKVGDFCFIGAGAIVIQGTEVPPRTFVKAGTVWKGNGI
jgi:sugar O-acyltransferase (sialic acid O-acetyltransferase NeuD family)